MRLCFLLERRVPAVPSPLIVEVADLLRRRGFTVDCATPEEMLLDVDRLEVRHDLYLLKSHTPLGLSLAGALAAQGARVLNRLDACVAADDKLQTVRRLAAAGLPVPRTYVTGDLATVAGLLAEGRPLLVKPLRGYHGQGVHVVRDAADLAAVPAPAGPVLVQDYVAGPGEDLKVYGVGERTWAVRKPFSPTSFSVPGRPVPVPAEVADLAVRAGRVAGLGLYGLDLIEGPDGPVVVDLNYYPGYRGCSGVAGPMADHITERALGEDPTPLPAPLTGTVSARASVAGRPPRPDRALPV